MDKRIKVLADYYGLETQLIKLCEECGELTTAAAKQLVSPNKIIQNALLDNLISELADVYVISEQIKYLLVLDDRIRRVADYKINRQLRRMEQDVQYMERLRAEKELD